MTKGCCLCEANAEFVLKGTTDYYCKECALDFFGDIGLLLPLEEEAQVLAKFVEEKMKVDNDGQFVVVDEKEVNVKKKKKKVKKEQSRKNENG
jgi:hypothetical protein